MRCRPRREKSESRAEVLRVSSQPLLGFPVAFGVLWQVGILSGVSKKFKNTLALMQLRERIETARKNRLTAVECRVG